MNEKKDEHVDVPRFVTGLTVHGPVVEAPLSASPTPPERKHCGCLPYERCSMCDMQLAFGRSMEYRAERDKPLLDQIEALSRQLDVLQAEKERVERENKELRHEVEHPEFSADEFNELIERAEVAEGNLEAAERERDTLRAAVRELLAINPYELDGMRLLRREWATLRSLVSDPEKENARDV